jgi:hypothetical protein
MALHENWGNWVLAMRWYGGLPYFITAQSTGIHEVLSFNPNGSYSISKNGMVADIGTYKTATVTSPDGERVARIQYSNTRVTDSIDYFIITHNNDSLAFGSGMMGIDGSGSRVYVRQ